MLQINVAIQALMQIEIVSELEYEIISLACFIEKDWAN